MNNREFDVIVIGSGPAGATASTLLAQNNYRILVLEKDQHPRFHIGESLLPMSAPTFQRLGIHWDSSSYLPKGGAEFIDEQNGRHASFPLATTLQPYQVERAKFDRMMIENAQSHGVILHENEAAHSVNLEDDQVHVLTSKGDYKARYLIDATGRSALMGRKFKAIKRIHGLGKYALYTHFSKVNSSAAKALFQSGNIKILMLDIGWFWIIPLVDNRISVGLVVQKDDLSHLKRDALFREYFSRSDILNELLHGAEQETPIQAEADFSFKNINRYGKRFACCGDAAGFLDPVFSSGVFMAVSSAERIADRLIQALQNHTEGDPSLHTNDDEDYLLGFNSMMLFVERFYNYDLVQHLFFESQRDELVKNDILGLLAGDLWSENNNFQKMLLSGRQSDKIVI